MHNVYILHKPLQEPLYAAVSAWEITLCLLTAQLLTGDMLAVSAMPVPQSRINC